MNNNIKNNLTEDNPSICKASNVSFGYTLEKDILNNISFTINSGEIVGILGKNGCGKSTLLNLIAGFLRNYRGSILINNKSISSYSCKELACKIAYIQQNQMNIPQYYTVEEFVIEGRRPFRRFGIYKKEDYELLDNTLKTCNLDNFKEKKIRELSGGELQRCFFAEAIMKEANLFLFDEPCSAMDIKYQIDFFKIVKDYKNKHQDVAIIITIHDINLAVNNCDRLIILDEGSIIYDDLALNVEPEVISNAFQIDVACTCKYDKFFYY